MATRVNNKPKRLIGKRTLDELVRLVQMGVPVSVAHKTVGLDALWSYASTAAIVRVDMDPEMDASLTRPDWLAQGPLLQTAPAGVGFRGTYPYGKWVEASPLAPSRVKPPKVDSYKQLEEALDQASEAGGVDTALYTLEETKSHRDLEALLANNGVKGVDPLVESIEV